MKFCTKYSLTLIKITTLLYNTTIPLWHHSTRRSIEKNPLFKTNSDLKDLSLLGPKTKKNLPAYLKFISAVASWGL